MHRKPMPNEPRLRELTAKWGRVAKIETYQRLVGICPVYEL